MILQTARLILREFQDSDADFILRLLNTPGWLQYIGNRNMQSIEDALAYIAKLRRSYAETGCGLYAVDLKEEGSTIGMCGFVVRDFLPCPDIGFAFLPEYGGKGYAHEAASATMDYAHHSLKMKQLAAITAPDNTASLRLLEKIGMQFCGIKRFADEEEESALFMMEWKE